jgi:hypothetical protein
MRRALQGIHQRGVGYSALIVALVACLLAALAWLDSDSARPLQVELEAAQDHISTGRIDIKDPLNDGNAFTTKKLLSYGPFTIRGECRDLGSFNNHVTISSSKKAFAAGQSESTDPDTIGQTPGTLSPIEGSLNVGAANPRSVTAFTPSGKFISVQIFEVNRATGNDANDCSFWVVGHGRK